MNDQNGFDNNGVYHFNYSSQPSDPWERPGQSAAPPPQLCLTTMLHFPLGVCHNLQ